MILSERTRCLARLLLAVGFVNSASAVIKGNDYQHYQQQLPGDHFSKDFYRVDSKNGLLGSYATFKPITECMFVTSEPGTFVYTSKTDDDEVCGIYFLAGPDQKVEIEFRMLDVPCEHRGLISVIDGWELNGEVFPSEMDHRLPMKQRNVEFCGKNIATKRTFTSSQNAAVIQYRIPKASKGFTVTARFVKNFRRELINISLLSIRKFKHLNNFQCDETSPRDQLIIGGSYGLDTSKLQIVDSICGIDSKPDFRELVEYEVTSVRLESSGFFENSATVQILPLI
ncbi:corticotropin-releasing factor-binding protein [Ceratina calcarata]|uniref:Corticotropin-releasing factor-binding protein n=1 Tax=Ceratina calcarata TaxID=156304 RepID=A0AAJ7WFR5_9HYME|nr:corticotropin-releasing factor-binding protein [Ceratina calcarata]